MWLFTDFGYFSITEPVRNKDQLQVRGRAKEDLEAFKARLAEKGLTSSVILEDQNRDYRFRFFATKMAVAAIVSDVVLNLDYHNFKDTVHRRQGHERAEVYLWVWRDLLPIQSGQSFAEPEEQPIQDMPEVWNQTYEGPGK